MWFYESYFNIEFIKWDKSTMIQLSVSKENENIINDIVYFVEKKHTQ